jgi:hypothetical protein
MLQHDLELGTTAEPNRDPSRSILAWPLRRQMLPPDAGCVALLTEDSSKDFWTSTDPPR